MIFETVRKDGIEGEIKKFERLLKTDMESERIRLEIIKTRIGNPRGCMSLLRDI